MVNEPDSGDWEDLPDDDIDMDALGRQTEALRARAPEPEQQRRPLFQTLFAQSIDTGDAVLVDFARCVVGNLSQHFALKAAKGGAFFQERLAEYEQGRLKRDPHDYGHDQTLRAHLINGMLPALHVARLLHEWNAPALAAWNATAERLFIAGYMLHDFTKIEDAQAILKARGFREGESPSQGQIPVLEEIFLKWSYLLNIDEFLKDTGTIKDWLQPLIYVACNTQRLKGTIHASGLLPNISRQMMSLCDLAVKISHLADLLAYVAVTPRDVVTHSTIRETLTKLTLDLRAPGKPAARLVYHHVAENRGVLLNFIHNAVIGALKNDDRVPLLYAPSGVVYLERQGAPEMPKPAELAGQIVDEVRQTAGKQLIETGKGAKRGNTGFQADDSYNDFFSLPDMLRASSALIERHIRNNKCPDRLGKLQAEGWAYIDTMPAFPSDVKDARVDRIAEWAGFIENQYRDRLNEANIAPALLEALEIQDMAAEFYNVRNRVKDSGKSGGIQLWWFWAAAHALNRKHGMDDAAVLEWVHDMARSLAQALPEDLPEKARMNETTWHDLVDYVGHVLTVGGVKSIAGIAARELNRYSRAKSGRGGAVCALCGSEYATRKPAETAVSFQPGVYTARIRVAASDNKRNLCSICAMEQLLRQLFVENLDTGSAAESQRIRYLSFYPSYFFTPETLLFIKRAYDRIQSVRISDKNLWAALRNAEDLTNATFWQVLNEFLLRPQGANDDAKFKRVVRYSEAAQSTFLMAGFRNIDPTETESWVLPAWLALVFSVCLDVKVVVSDSSTPLMLESAELRKTLWFDGAHAAVQALIGDGQVNIDGVGKALARLTAAYLIHLDTAYDPPKENWQRFAPMAHALMESPLYVFHYLKQQERDDRPIGAEQVRRYVRYAEELFNEQGDMLMSHAKELVTLYRGFYRAKTLKNANSVLRPISVVADALLIADPDLFKGSDALVELAYGELARFMDRVGKGLADGRFPKGITVPERDQAMRKFCQTFVNDIFIGVFSGDVAALRGKQLNLLRSACEALYKDAQHAEWDARGREADETDDADSAEA